MHFLDLQILKRTTTPKCACFKRESFPVNRLAFFFFVNCYKLAFCVNCETFHENSLAFQAKRAAFQAKRARIIKFKKSIYVCIDTDFNFNVLKLKRYTFSVSFNFIFAEQFHFTYDIKMSTVINISFEQ